MQTYELEPVVRTRRMPERKRPARRPASSALMGCFVWCLQRVRGRGI